MLLGYGSFEILCLLLHNITSEKEAVERFEAKVKITVDFMLFSVIIQICDFSSKLSVNMICIRYV
jgi:hypothetical protein